ncbi:TIGR02677 family protein [Halobacillus amylolyticus]|uniref:TIGR02677 family protein n=1 Tax=Halobacillus amylolyticus TaxID=2932259 RepID=A0ABY4HFD1_9BACI|nr:TIGR02677 family protein [Halobacillus amylolyticus]UOR13491.1 TIGR02677 family protein [Halobacillus amylolyticus]
MVHSFKRVKEATYLTAEKSWSYRAILRYFYIQHERMREFLFPEEIYAHLKESPDFQDYTEEALHQDLDALVKWGNLLARQELGRSRTVEEFKKKRFRYQCTPYTVEFERMLVQLERIGENFGGSLEKTQFDRIYQSLLQVEAIAHQKESKPNEECAQIFEDVMTYFKQITQNTSDYIAYINSEEVEERMQTEAFLVYKDQFTMYLRDFIIALQSTVLQIQDLLSQLGRHDLQGFFTQVIDHQDQVFRFEEDSDEDPLEENMQKWWSLKAWFLGGSHGESEFEMLQMRTNETIRRITRVVQRLGERHQYFRSRKKDYLHLANWFASIENIEEAHELSSVAFGVFHTRHLWSDQIPSDDIYLDVWDEEPMIHRTNPRIRNYQEKTKAGAIESRTSDKQEMMQIHLEKRKQEKLLIEKYVNHDAIHVEDLPVVESHVRKILLTWLGKAMARKDRTIKTEYGRRVHVELVEGARVVLRSEDGELEMPKATFQFIGEKENS